MTRRTRIACWTAGTLAACFALAYALQPPPNPVRQLSWNVRAIIGARLGKDVGALTTNDLAAISVLTLNSSDHAIFYLPMPLASFQRYIPNKKMVMTDPDLIHLNNLSGLQLLGLSGAKVTDAGLEHLTKSSSLQRLDLSDTQVTDAGLAHLTNLPSLKVLYLQQTQVTDAGVAELQKKLPECEIIR